MNTIVDLMSLSRAEIKALVESAGLDQILADLDDVSERLIIADRFDDQIPMAGEDGNPMTIGQLLEEARQIVIDASGVAPAIAEEAAPEPEPEPVAEEAPVEEAPKKKKKEKPADISNLMVDAEGDSGRDARNNEEAEKKFAERKEAQARREASRSKAAEPETKPAAPAVRTESGPPPAVRAKLIKDFVAKYLRSIPSGLLGKNPEENIRILSEQSAANNVLALGFSEEEVAKYPNAAGLTISDIRAVSFFQSEDGSWSVRKPGSEQATDFVLAMPVIAVNLDVATTEESIKKTVVHETWHGLIRFLYNSDIIIKVAMTQLAASLRSTSPAYVDAIEKMIRSRYPEGYQYIEEEVAVHIATEFHHLIAADPNNLASVAKKILDGNGSAGQKRGVLSLVLETLYRLYESVAKLGASGNAGNLGQQTPLGMKLMSEQIEDLAGRIARTYPFSDKQDQMADDFPKIVNTILTITSQLRPIYEGAKAIQEKPAKGKKGGTKLLIMGDDSDLRNGDYEYVSSKRDLPAKRIGGKSLELEGVSIVESSYPPRFMIGEEMVAAPNVSIDTIVKKVSKKNAEQSRDEKRISIDLKKIRSSQQYKGLSSQQRAVVDAIITSSYPTGDSLMAAFSYVGKMPAEIEAQIESVVRASGTSRKLKSTVEFLVRLKVNSTYGRYLADNAKKNDEGWAIPPIKTIAIKDGKLAISTEKLNWDLDTNAKDKEGRPQRVVEAATRLADEVASVAEAARDGDPEAKWIIKERAWYTNTMNLLSRAFGPQFKLFNELLAVFSPRTPADVNFNYAVEAIENLTKGVYDTFLNQYYNWLADTKRKDRIASLTEDQNKALAEWRKSRLPGQSKLKSEFDKTVAGSILKSQLHELKNWSGETPFRLYTIRLGDPFPYTPRADSEGTIIEVKNPPRFTGLDSFIKKYGPKKLKGESDSSERYIEARREFIAELIQNNPDSFDESGNLLSDASITYSPLFGPNSRQALDVMVNIWAVARTNPKTPTFNANLLGTSIRATIDVWAARAVRWATGQSRIPPFAERAVAGKIEAGDIDMTTKDFGFGQVVFEQAAEILTNRNIEGLGNIDAMNLQAVAWFMWKRTWNKNGWSSIPWTSGSFERSFAAQPMLMVEAEFDVDQSGSVVGEIVNELKADKSVVSVFVSDDPTTPNQSRNLTVTVRSRQFDTNAFAARVAKAAADSGSSRRVTVSQTLPLDAEKTDSSRTGLIAYFKRSMKPAEAAAFIRKVSSRGWTISPMYEMQRAASGEARVVGIKAIYSAEASVSARKSVLKSDSKADSMDAVSASAFAILAYKLGDYRSVIGNPAMIAVESVTYGPEGIRHDEPGMAPFTDYRGPKVRQGQSVSTSVAAAAGIRTQLGRPAGLVGDITADGPSGTTRTELNGDPDGVPQEVQRMHVDFAESAYPNTEMVDGRSTPIEAPGLMEETGEEDSVRFSIPIDTPIGDKSIWKRLRQYFRFSARSNDIRITGGQKEGDLGQLRRWLIPTLNSAWSSGIPLVRKITETMISLDLERQRASASTLRDSEALYEQLPKEYRKDEGRKFFELMDRHYDPDWPKSDSRWVDADGNRLPDSVIDILSEFKRMGEMQRLGIIAEKREAMREVVSRMKLPMLVKVAGENGGRWSIVKIEPIPGARPVEVIMDDDTGDIMGVEDAREAIVMLAVPDNWGRQYAHIYHGFFGAYEMIWYSRKAYENALASGLSNSEAMKMAKRSVSMDGGTATEPTEARAVRRMLAFMENPPLGIDKDDIMEPTINVEAHVPPDVVRLSGKQYDWLRRDIQEAADIESNVVSQLLRGKVGRLSTKKRFYASVLQRKGKGGFNMDFMQAWKAQTNGYYKWLYFNRMRAETQDSIELVRSAGYIGWANHLQENLEYTVSFKQTSFEQLLDGTLASIPILRTLVGPLPSRRFLQMLRTFNVYRQLLTGRQQIVNSLQPFQTVYPLIGGRRMVNYIKRYNGKDGKALMARFGYLRADGSWYEGRDFESAVMNKPWFRRLKGGIDNIYRKSIGRAIDSSAEARNQNFTFAAFYWYATEELGMDDDNAARHALLRVAHTQFAFSKANTPVVLRGPTRATLLQYKRFMLNSFGLAMNMLSENHPLQKGKVTGLERTAIFGRWLLSFLVMGGLKGLPLFFLASFISSLFTGGEDDTNYDIHNGLREQLGEGWADVIVMGLPAAAGVDISGSITLFPKPYGRTVYDMAGSFLVGPSVSAGLDIVKSVYDKNSIGYSNTEELFRGVYASSPAAQQFGTLYDLIVGESEQRDVTGRLKFRRTTAEAVRALFGFRTIRETIESLEYEKVVSMNETIDGLLDEIAQNLADGKFIEAQRAAMNWNSIFPEAPIPLTISKLMKQRDIAKRVAGKVENRDLDTRQRRLKKVNDRLERILVKREGFEEYEFE